MCGLIHSERITKIYNDSRDVSDHNVVGAVISVKNFKFGGHNIVKRSWKDFSEKECIKMFNETNWDDITNEMDVNVANSLLEDRIRGILDKIAPMRTVQARTKYHNWISSDTKNEMRLRDRARELDKITDLNSVWLDFKNRRNICTGKQRNDKKLI